MRLKIEDLEDQIIATLAGGGEEFTVDESLSEGQDQVDLGVLGKTEGLEGVLIKTLTSELNILNMTQTEFNEGYIRRMPFVLINFAGLQPLQTDSPKKSYQVQVRFRLYIGCKSVRFRREAQLQAYFLQRRIFDLLNDKVWKADVRFAPEFERMDGVAITESGFNGWTPLMLANTPQMVVVVNLPGAVVYKMEFIANGIAAYEFEKGY